MAMNPADSRERESSLCFQAKRSNTGSGKSQAANNNVAPTPTRNPANVSQTGANNGGINNSVYEEYGIDETIVNQLFGQNIIDEMIETLTRETVKRMKYKLFPKDVPTREEKKTTVLTVLLSLHVSGRELRTAG